MAATNPIVPKNSYNNIKVAYITPFDSAKTVAIASHESYPSSGSLVLQVDGATSTLLVNNLDELTASNGVVILHAKPVLPNNHDLKAYSSAAVATNMLKLNASDTVEWNKTVRKSVSYSPAFVTTGGMTATGTVNYARYLEDGEMVTVWIHATAITTGGSASSTIGFELPFAAKNLGFDQYGGGASVTDTGTTTGAFTITNNSINAGVQKNDKGSFGLGGSRSFIGCFSYLRA